MMLDGQSRRLSQNTGQEEKANSVDVGPTMARLTLARHRVRPAGREVPRRQDPGPVPGPQVVCYTRRTIAHASIGEESYDGEEVTDAPTWIGELRSAYA